MVNYSHRQMMVYLFLKDQRDTLFLKRSIKSFILQIVICKIPQLCIMHFAFPPGGTGGLIARATAGYVRAGGTRPYSERRAVTGSCRAALREGIRPPRRVRKMDKATRMAADRTGRKALILTPSAMDAMILLAGISSR